MKMAKSSRHRNVPWGDLPHARLSSEIAQTIAYRSPHEAHYELQLRNLGMRLPERRQNDHVEYTRLISAEINRKLRICRDVYRKYLEPLNNKSRTAKWSVVLDFAVAPRASQILRNEVCAYLRNTKIELWMVEIFLRQNVRMVMVPLGRGEVQTPSPGELSLEEIIRSVVPDKAFQNVKTRFKKESFIVGGPFAQPHILRCAMSYRVSGEEISMLLEENEIWISQAGRMWDNVLHEIVAQQVQIDLEERSDAMAAAEVLSPFERIAGPLYSEASQRYTTIPDQVWADIGGKLDRARISLKETLEPTGKKVLRDLARHDIHITTWQKALVCESNFGVLETKIIVDGVLKYRGMLNRHSKRAVYRASDKYRKVLEDVYEKRVFVSKRSEIPTACEDT